MSTTLSTMSLEKEHEIKNRLSEIKMRTLSEMKTVRDKIDNFTNKKKEIVIKAMNNFNEFENHLTNETNEVENLLKFNTEIKSKLEIEKTLLVSTTISKEREISEMEFLVLQKLPTEFSNFEFLFKKELEIHNKMKMENNFLYSKNQSLANEIKEMIQIYKKMSHVDLEKTKEGFLKIIFFRNVENSKLRDGANLVVEIKEGNFKIISIFPQIKISQLEEELQNSHNFTLFLTKLANEFLKYIN